MCVAIVLILNNLYAIYDALFDYCEHITAAVLLFITTLIIFLPVVALLAPEVRLLW